MDLGISCRETILSAVASKFCSFQINNVSVDSGGAVRIFRRISNKADNIHLWHLQRWKSVLGRTFNQTVHARTHSQTHTPTQMYFPTPKHICAWHIHTYLIKHRICTESVLNDYCNQVLRTEQAALIVIIFAKHCSFLNTLFIFLKINI